MHCYRKNITLWIFLPLILCCKILKRKGWEIKIQTFIYWEFAYYFVNLLCAKRNQINSWWAWQKRGPISKVFRSKIWCKCTFNRGGLFYVAHIFCNVRSSMCHYSDTLRLHSFYHKTLKSTVGIQFHYDAIQWREQKNVRSNYLALMGRKKSKWVKNQRCGTCKVKLHTNWNDCLEKEDCFQKRKRTFPEPGRAFY